MGRLKTYLAKKSTSRWMETSDGKLIPINDSFYPVNTWYYFMGRMHNGVFVIEKVLLKE